jgi:hypothetical protein
MALRTLRPDGKGGFRVVRGTDPVTLMPSTRGARPRRRIKTPKPGTSSPPKPIVALRGFWRVLVGSLTLPGS